MEPSLIITDNTILIFGLNFFLNRFLLHIYRCTYGEVQDFFHEKKTKNLRPNELLIVMQRENQRISFLSLKQNHKEIFSALDFYDFIFNAPAHHILYFFMTKLASNLSFTLFKIILL